MTLLSTLLQVSSWPRPGQVFGSTALCIWDAAYRS